MDKEPTCKPANIRISRSGSERPIYGVGGLVCRILLFMWSLGLLVEAMGMRGFVARCVPYDLEVYDWELPNIIRGHNIRRPK